ncbi:MAG: carboxypeptidase-like regulatory domain-containing protein [Bacteroidetes bacterium]|nr:MAG: carboxypeptidase-like regulatory domain-containing protein [Bacteroidota bacterium]
MSTMIINAFNMISLKQFVILLLFQLLLQSFPLQAQIPVQSIRGQVNDQTGLPLPGVNVVVLDHDPVLGTTTDPEGNFSLQNVPVGRHTLRFSSIGYETVYKYNLRYGTIDEDRAMIILPNLNYTIEF